MVASYMPAHRTRLELGVLQEHCAVSVGPTNGSSTQVACVSGDRLNAAHGTYVVSFCVVAHT